MSASQFNAHRLLDWAEAEVRTEITPAWFIRPWPILAGLVLAATLTAASAATDEDLDALFGQDAQAAESEQSSPDADKASEPSAENDAEAQTYPDTIPVGDDALPKQVTRTQPQRNSRVIDEIVVTAQKREQSIRDVPVSMMAFDEEFIAREGITDLSDLSAYTPNVSFEEAGLLIRPVVRGFSVDADNYGFEPPVGIAIDEIPYTRLNYFTAGMYDVQGVEVLRGPQGTTFGKNTTAGLVILRTRDPGEEFTGFVDLQLGELGRERAELGIGGPLLGEAIQFRIAGLFDRRDGFVRNTTADVVPDLPRFLRGRRREAGRLKLRLPDLLGSDLVLSYDHSDFDSLGIGGELFFVSDSTQDYLRQFDPAADFEADNRIVSTDGGDFLNASTDTAQLRWTYDPGDWGFNAVAGHSRLDIFGFGDADFTPASIALARVIEQSETSTLELRFTTPTLAGLAGLDRAFGLRLGETELLAGIFLQRRQIAPNEVTGWINDATFAGLTASDQAAGATGGGLAGVRIPAGVQPLPPGLGLSPVDERFTRTLQQDAKTIALFGQLDWHIRNRWTLQTGLRISRETKDGNFSVDLSENRALLTAARFEEFSAPLYRREDQIQPKISLNYKPSSGMSLFASWAQAFKGGGFNGVAEGPSDEDLQFEDERVTQWALDAKTRLLGGTLMLNLSLYHMTLFDFQVLTTERSGPQDQIVATRVVNAPKALAQGVEADFNWRPFTWLRMLGALGFNDTEFIDFPFGSCPLGNSNSDGDEDPRCDQSGRPFPFAPRWNGTLTTNLDLPMPQLGGWLESADLTIGLTAEYQGFQFLHDSLDERLAQDANVRYKANVGIADAGRGWSFRIVGENLSDEIVSVERRPAFGTSSFLSIINSPRQLYAQFRYSY